jgi:DNA-binding NtrC family response regulator
MTALKPDLPILIVDDEQDVAHAIERTLRINGYNNLHPISDSREVLNTLEKSNASLVILDITMPFISGDKLLVEIVARYPCLPVIMATAMDSAELVVDCMRKGAYDYIGKPLSTNRLLASIGGALELWELRRENKALRNKEKKGVPAQPAFFSEILTQNADMLALFRYIEVIAPSSQAVLVSGETGVGKELFALAIHNASGRKGRFVAVNVAGVDDEVFSDTLFGHIKGAFTGANSDREGQIKKAASGTLFLDEIGDLSLKSQVKLLRLLQEKVYLPLGADTARETDARIIVAINQNLEEMVAKGTFRKDLYYRIYAHHVAVPPLRQRFDDLPLLIKHFVQLAADELGKKPMTIPEQLYPFLRNHAFPGNIRELQAVILDAASRQAGSHLGLDTVASILSLKKNQKNAVVENDGEEGKLVTFGTVLPSMQEVRILLIKEALKRADGNGSLAAKFIGITRQSLAQFLKRHNISL